MRRHCHVIMATQWVWDGNAFHLTLITHIYKFLQQSTSILRASQPVRSSFLEYSVLIDRLQAQIMREQCIA
jgi:hypothetical protein